MPKTRRPLDQYFTPFHAVEQLLAHERPWIDATVLEPCAGDGAIAIPLRQHGLRVAVNDIDPSLLCSGDGHDATSDAYWDIVRENPPDCVISNPPFSAAFTILQKALSVAQESVSFLLRITFLEPTNERGAWLEEHPPHSLLVLPRISFTGDGRTDSATCAWMTWLADGAEPGNQHIHIVRKFA